MLQKRSKFGMVWLVLLVIAGFVGGCTTMSPQGEMAASNRVPGANPLAAGAFIAKVDGVAVILDASQTMNAKLGPDSKFDLAKTTVDRMVRTLPTDFDAVSSLYTFGHSPRQSEALTERMLDPSGFNPKAFRNALAIVKFAGGNSPLAKAIDAAGVDLAETNGPQALIIVSDGRQMDDAPAAAENLKAALGDRLCIYTIWVGQDPKGEALLERIAQIGGCGTAMAAGALGSPHSLAQFVTEALLKPAPAPVAAASPPPGDADGDGITDDRDHCPDTPKGARVNDRGCWIVGGPLFDLDKDWIKPQYHGLLDDIIVILQQNPVIRVEIQGHTCDIGRTGYNQKLSERRAQAVANYLMKNGVDYQRLSAVGYGETRPVAPNDSESHRMKNRRVELKIIK